MNSTLIVRHFPEYLSDEAVHEFFSFFGATHSKAAKGRMKGAVLVTFPSHDLAKKAISELDQMKLLDKTLTADWDKNTTKVEHQHQDDKIFPPIAKNLGLDYPSPPYLEYKYPMATPMIVQNIATTLLHVPKFYEQVLHLMNKMNLPPPFGLETPKSQAKESSAKRKKKREPSFHEDESTLKRVKSEHRVPLELYHRHEPMAPVQMKISMPDLITPVQPVSVSNVELDVVQGAPPETKDELFEKPWNPISKEDIIKNRLTIEQIKDMPKFKDYQEGEPSCKLYIKNIDKKVNAEVLEHLFSFPFGSKEEMDREIEIKLMTTGRLKGQAFVTFTSIDKAKDALSTINGYVLFDKPLIIAFGKNK